MLGGAEHGGDDALHVTRAAAVDKLVILAGSEEGRHGVQVRGERHGRIVAEAGENVEPVLLDLDLLVADPSRGPSVLEGHSLDLCQNVLGHSLLISSDGLDVDEGTREMEDVHGYNPPWRLLTVSSDGRGESSRYRSPVVRFNWRHSTQTSGIRIATFVNAGYYWAWYFWKASI